MRLVNAIPLLAPVLFALIATSSCRTPEDPAHALVRARLKQEARLSNEDISRALDEVGKTLAGKTIGVKSGGVIRELDQEQHEAVLGVLTERAGVYDEGLRAAGNGSARIINAPGKSILAEYQASRRLWIDVETLRPVRFDFVYDVPGVGDYSLDLLVSP